MADLNTLEALNFLQEPHVGVFAVATDGAPAAVPLWYCCAPDGAQVWIHTPRGSRKARWLERGRPATLVVQTVTPRVRFVSVELELVGHRPAEAADARELAGRYLSGEALEGYLQFAEEHLTEDRYTFRTTRWRSADLTT